MCIRDRCGTWSPVGPINGGTGRGGYTATHSRRSYSLHAACLLYTSDAADERSSVDLGGRRIIKKKIKIKH